MFTGIITDIGTIARTEARGDLRIVVHTAYDMAGVDLGASIACSGVCLTVIDKSGSGADGWFAADVSGETLSRTPPAHRRMTVADTRHTSRRAAETVRLTVNGSYHALDVEPATPLLYILRNDLGLNAPKFGCGLGLCGACTVRVNGEIVRGCLMLAVQCDGAVVETIEGLSDTGEIADLQAAFEQRNALQCGYCTPGMLTAAQDLLLQAKKNGDVPSREEIREHLSGNYCRCTGYHNIVKAVAAGAQAMKA